MVKKTDSSGSTRRKVAGHGVLLTAAIATLAASVGVDPAQAQPTKEMLKKMDATQIKKGTSAVQTKVTKERQLRDSRQHKVDAMQHKVTTPTR